MSTRCPPKTRMFNRRNILSLAICLLAATSGWLLGISFTSAVPAPNTNSTCEPGNCTVQQCRAIVYKSGTQAVDKDGITGIGNKASGSDDAVIQDAINNILDAGRTQKEKVCLNGSFTLAATITIPDYTLMDFSSALITLTTNTSPNPAFKNSNYGTGTNQYIEIAGGIFNGITGTDVSGSEAENMFDFKYVSNLQFHEVTCTHISGECMFLRRVTFATLSDNIITDKSVAGAFAFLLGSGEISIIANHIATWDTPITIYNATRITVADNDLTAHPGNSGGGPCIEMITQTTTPDNITDMYVHHNTCWGSHSKCIWVHHQDATHAGVIANVWIEDNTCRNMGPSQDGIELNQFGSQMWQIHVDRNSLYSMPAQCISYFNNSVSASLLNSTFNFNNCYSSGGDAIRVQDLFNSTIIGNRVTTASGSDIRILNFPVAGKCGGLIVTGNVLDYASRYGIEIDPSCNWSLVEQNSVQTNTLGGINNGGSNNMVRYNIGYKTENQGASTITASTSVTVSHGLVGTPTSCMITMETTGFTSDWISAIGTTSFTLTVTTSGTYNFFWSCLYWP